MKVGILVTRRAAERHVVTASKCGIYCFNSYLITFRNRAVIMHTFCVCMETDEEEFLAATFPGSLMPLL